MYFIQYTHQQLCRYVVNTTQIYTVHSSAALQLDCVFSLSVNPLHFTMSGLTLRPRRPQSLHPPLVEKIDGGKSVEIEREGRNSSEDSEEAQK